MQETTVSLVIAIIALIISIMAYFSKNSGTEQPKPASNDISVKPLQLQAYERLVILTERIALPNLISRLNQYGLTAREMQILLIETIKQEFEYNSSQQIYVSEPAWDAVRNLRDQNMLMINTIAKTLAPEATAGDLNRQLIETMMQEEREALHTYAANTLNAEAKKIM
jgi:hypothetical protein